MEEIAGDPALITALSSFTDTYLATFHSEDLVDSLDAHGCVITGLSEMKWWRGADMIRITLAGL